MPCLAAQFDRRIGPLVPLGLVAAEDPATHALRITALIDTGATASCITSEIASQLGLAPMGRTLMASATHTIEVDQFLVDLVIPIGRESVVRQGLMVSAFSGNGTTDFQMLLGRDILCTGVFTMSMDGHFTLSL